MQTLQGLVVFEVVYALAHLSNGLSELGLGRLRFQLRYQCPRLAVGFLKQDLKAIKYWQQIGG